MLRSMDWPIKVYVILWSYNQIEAKTQGYYGLAMAKSKGEALFERCACHKSK